MNTIIDNENAVELLESFKNLIDRKNSDYKKRKESLWFITVTLIEIEDSEKLNGEEKYSWHELKRREIEFYEDLKKIIKIEN